MPDVVYRASPTLARFHACHDRVRVIRGPVGSGKTTACCWEIWRRAHEQRPSPDGVRRSRWLITRATYPELRDTTFQSWLSWFGEHRTGCAMRWSDMTHEIRCGDVHLEVIGRSLESESDVRKLLSLEITGAWCNEARDLPITLVNRLSERVGRYPPATEGGASWHGIIMDTNPADEDAPLTLLEHEPPRDWRFFVQPPGLLRLADGRLVTNSRAENLEHLPRGYYETNLGTLSLDEIRVYRMNEPGFLVEGRPCVTGFHEAMHVQGGFEPRRETLHLGLDIGGGTLTPGVVWLQRSARGVIWVHDAAVLDDCAAEQLAVELARQLHELSPWHATRPDMVRILADPAGNQREPLFADTVLEHLRRRLGWAYETAATQDVRLRIGAVQGPVSRLVDGVPGLVVHPRARVMIKALKGGWHFTKTTSGGIPRFSAAPAKNRWSHPADALGYALLCLGELRTQEGRAARARGARRPLMASVGSHLD